jgi:hypothetical protein
MKLFFDYAEMSKPLLAVLTGRTKPRKVTEDIQGLYNPNATVWCGIPEAASHLMVMEMGKCMLRI